MRRFVWLAMPLLAVTWAGCGNTPATDASTSAAATGGASNGNAAAAGGNNVVLSSTTSSSKMVQQTQTDTEEQSDLAEMASTGTDDNAGTASTPRAPSASFGFQPATAVNLQAISSAFDAGLHFTGHKTGDATLDGNVSAHVAPRMAGGNADAGNLTLTLTFDLNRTLANGDVVVVATEPNLSITRAGDRTSATLTRTLNGKVRRTLTSVHDANANFDLEITYAGTTVVDTYVNAALSSRVTNGTTTVNNKLTGEVAAVTFNGLTRGKPSACLCPTGGSIDMVVTGTDGAVTTHTYTFDGTCGAATVNASGTVTADVNKSAANAALGTNAAATTGGNATVGSSAHVTGELSWQNCLPQSSSN